MATTTLAPVAATTDALAAATTDAPAATTTDAAAAWSGVGWWRSDALCFELFANGDFELSLMSDTPKVQVLGTAKLIPRDAEHLAVKLVVTRIWRARYVSPCRRTAELGRWINSQNALGVAFKRSAGAELTLKRVDDTHIELCGQTCATLKRATPVLAGRWRGAGYDYPDHPAKPWAVGELLELSLDDASTHIWIGQTAGAIDTVDGHVKIRFIDADRFAVTLIAADIAHAFTATRLAGERLNVCGANKRCATLERQFDSYEYDLH